MATIEKPKYKKKKKLQHQNVDNDNDIPSAIDLEFPQTTTRCGEILSHECFVSSEFQSLTIEQKDNIDKVECTNYQNDTDHRDNKEEASMSNTNEVSKENIKSEYSPKENDICNKIPIALSTMGEKTSAHKYETPSAPELTESITNKQQFKFTSIVKYPDLKEIKLQEEQLTDKLAKPMAIKQKLKPFTISQIKAIYSCQEIEEATQFELVFLTNSFQENFSADPLYNLLLQYSYLRSKLRVNSADKESLTAKINQIESDLWTTEERTVDFEGICGDGFTVRGSETYKIAVLSTSNLETINLTLNQFNSLVCFSYITNLVYSQITKIKIEQIVREILSYPILSKITENTPMVLNKGIAPQNINCINHLRRAISIFFSFIRKPTPDKIFLTDIETWLIKLVAYYLKVATKEDFWFLIFHILRCPSGVSSWATPLFQIPKTEMNKSPDCFTNSEINNCIAILNILLNPIKKRNEFLSAFSQSYKDISDPVKDDLWIFVDSDGEEGSTSTGECTGLKESDLIAFLNQIPFEALFTSTLNIQKNKDNLILNPNLITGNTLIKLIAFNSTVVELLGKGLTTYNTERYKQFAKRLGRLIRHCIQYISEYHELYIQNTLAKDPNLCERICVEFNAFVIKACSYIYQTRNLGTWQYFSSLPFANMDSDTLWQLFYYLNVGFPGEFPEAQEDFQENIQVSDFIEKFNTSISDISAEDLYYMLQAFFEMAIERDRAKDWDLIKTIFGHIFNIGFINETTRETCYKASRDVLVNLTLTHPDLISFLLDLLKTRFSEIENGGYLLKSLPLEKWKPEIRNFETLSYWLLNYNCETPENIISRGIISRLNWSFDTDNNLFLPHDIHIRMACLICEASIKHTPEIIGLSGISESVRHVSNIIENQTIKEQFSSWCWNMLYSLHLHLMDQNREYIKEVLQNPSEKLKVIPELKDINTVFQGVSENRPIALFLSILISSWGHSIPLICQKGIQQLRLLLNDYRHAVVIRCIQLIIPLFLECPDSLKNLESFQEVLKQLLNSDRTYIRMAKDLMSANSHGPVLELFSNMLQAQLIGYTEYGLASPKPFINLWLQTLTSIPNWQNTNVLYLIDIILKVAYQFPDAWHKCREHFKSMFTYCNEWKTLRISTFKMLLGNINSVKNPPTATAEHGWLALLLLEVEYEVQEESNRLWAEFLIQLSKASGKINMDNLLKKTTSLVAVSQFPASCLVVFKYANLISSLETSHPLLPIFCQNFFFLYLSRIPFNVDEERFQCTYGVADKLYEYNISLMKKLKSKLKQGEEYYQSEASKHSTNNTLVYFYTNCSKIMKTYLLWLEETSINKISKDQDIDLPPQFNTPKLKEILLGNKQHWTEYLYLPKIRSEQKTYALQWLKSCCRHCLSKNNSTSVNASKLSQSPLNRIKNHLKSYDKVVKPPDLSREPLLLKPLDPKNINKSTLNVLRNNLKTLEEYSKQFNLWIKELKSLHGNYKDLVPLLYDNKALMDVKFLKCSSLFSNCIKPAEVLYRMEKPQKNEVIQHKIETNRIRYFHLIDTICKQKVDKLVEVIQTMEHIVKYLVLFQNDLKDNKTISSQITDISTQFFFDIINDLNENMRTFPPGKEICTNLMLELGVFIKENQEIQGIRILYTALKRPELLKVLSELFVPSRTRPDSFLKMYGFLIDSRMRYWDTKILYALLSKFDLPNWFQNIKPKLSAINQLLKLVVMGLESWNQLETAPLQDLFRRHLVYIFECEFPEHYGEVLQMVLTASSEQKLMTEVLLDLLNSLLKRSGCESLTLASSQLEILEQAINFATQQKLFSYKEVIDTTVLFAQHFQMDRLQHGLHGLYPKHTKYCVTLSMWFSCFSHAIVASAIYTYPGVLADNICDGIFAPIVEMYSPWLVPYSEHNTQQSTANWIRQFISNGKILLPWSDLHVESAQIMLFSYVKCLEYVLESLPVSSAILGHVFSWYAYHFANPDVGHHIRAPVHIHLVTLPWERFLPGPNHIESFHKVLSEYLPECHAFLGHVFLRTRWENWIIEIFNIWNPTLQTRIMSLILKIFIQISFEPNVHDNLNTVKVLEEAFTFPWHLVDFQGVENIFNWLMVSTEPSIILKIPSESNNIDKAVLELLKISCGMKVSNKLTTSTSITKSKRVFYVTMYVRLLRACATKHPKLLATKEGLQAYRNTIVELIDGIERIAISSNMNRQDCEIETQNMLVEIISSLPSHNQETAKLFVEAIIMWQSTCDIGSPVLCRTLNVISLCKTFTNNMYSLMEATIYNYFRYSDDLKHIYCPSWVDVLEKLGHILDNLDLNILLKGPQLLSLHCYILHKIENLENQGEKIIFLQDLSQLLEPIKTNENTEAKIAIIWGAIISSGCKILQSTENAKKPLLMLARYLQVMSTQCESWGEGLLGVIGIKRDNVSNKRKILTRCLSCIIFSLFPDKNQEEKRPSQEFIVCLEDLRNVTATKKYNDIREMAIKAVGVIEENYFPESNEIVDKIYNIIRLLYSEHFLIDLPQVWYLEKCP